jgi:hypothetical protein
MSAVESPRPFFLPPESRSDTGERVVGVALGLTAWLAAPERWAFGGVAAVLRAFLAAAPPGALAWYTTSMFADWRPVGDGGADGIIASLSARTHVFQRLLHHFSVRLADHPEVPSVGFAYTEVDPARGDRAAVIELTLPQDADPGLLFQLAMELASTAPLHCLVGGYALRWNPRHQRLAFNRHYFWSKRYAAVDAVDAEACAWRVAQGLPGSNWLTLLGHGLMAARDISPDALYARAWTHAVRAIPTPGGLLLRAGELPTAGDRHTLEYPAAYAEVARALGDHFLDPPPPFWGAFLDAPDLTKRWMRRLIEPAGWE